MNEKLSWKILTVLVIAGLILAGCAPSAPTSAPTSAPAPSAAPTTAAATKAPAASGEAVTLTLGSWRTDDVKPMQVILDKFHERYPNITIKFSPTTPTEYDAAMTTQLQAGTGDDLYYLRAKGAGIAEKMYNAGHFIAIDGLPGLENLDPAALAERTASDGHVFGVSIYKNSMGIFYNEDIFTKLKLSLPKTWDELLATAKTLKDAGISPFANGYGEPAYVRSLFVWNWTPMVIGGSAGRQAYFTGKSCLNDDNWVQLFQMVKDVTPYLPTGAAALTNSDAQQYFLQGKAAMMFDGSYDIPIFQKGNPTFKWSIMPIPPLKGKDTYMVGELDGGVGINAKSKHIPEAKIFLSWLTTKEFAQLVPDNLTGNFPVTKDTDIKPANPYSNKFLELMAASKGTDVRFYMNTGTPGTSALFIDLTVAVLNGKSTPKEAAQSLYDGISTWSAEQKACKK